MSEYRPERLLCVVAHPDDIEFTVGGTIAKWSAAGTEVHYLICTDGSKGAKSVADGGAELAKTRSEEQEHAAKQLGVRSCRQLDYLDGTVRCNDGLRKDIVRAIRTLKPEAVFTLDPTFYYSAKRNYINHRDHRAVGQATFDAVYPMARDATSLPELLEENLQPHITRKLLLANFDNENHYINVTDFMRQKEAALRSHVSQFGNGDAIVSLAYEYARQDGESINVEYAEGFVLLDVSMGAD